jgi:hypothetical protein
MARPVLSVIGPAGLTLLGAVGALWAYRLVVAVLDKAVTTNKDVNVTVRFLPWPRIEIAVKCAEKRIGDHEDGDARAVEQRDGGAPAPEPKQ